MHPAPSLIVFTTLSGLGFGQLFFLGLGLPAATGWPAFLLFGMGYALVCAGLAASALHLGRPERALRAFSQWRTSWLSREAVLAAAALTVMAPHAFASVFLDTPLPWWGRAAAALSAAAVVSTAMIYAQLKTVPRWNHWSTPAVFLTAAGAGGGMLVGLRMASAPFLVLLALALLAHWHFGARRLRASGSTPGTATGLGGAATGAAGGVRQFEAPHTGPNYLLREMVHRVGRRHAARLRRIALICAAPAPLLALMLAPGLPGIALALLLHIPGILAARWLFFAEAEHVVGLYYGAYDAR